MLIPPEFDPRGAVIERVQREHHAALRGWGVADAGTIVVSVRTALSKAVHSLQTTLNASYLDHYEHLLGAAIAEWAEANRRGLDPTGPSFPHGLYGAVIGRGGQTIRSLSPAAKLVWDSTEPLAGKYVICMPKPTDEHAAWCHQLRARFDTAPGIQIGLPVHHPFGSGSGSGSGGGGGVRPGPQVEPPLPGVVIFGVDGIAPDVDLVALGQTLAAAFTEHTNRLDSEAPPRAGGNRGHWLLEAAQRAKIFPPFESSVLAAELAHGSLTVAVARRQWGRCRALVEAELARAGFTGQDPRTPYHTDESDELAPPTA
jgi:hypothetical protein